MHAGGPFSSEKELEPKMPEQDSEHCCKSWCEINEYLVFKSKGNHGPDECLKLKSSRALTTSAAGLGQVSTLTAVKHLRRTLTLDPKGGTVGACGTQTHQTSTLRWEICEVSGERYQHLKTYLMSWSEIYSTTQYSASVEWSIGSLIQKQQDGSW